MDDSRLLLMAPLRDDLITIGRALRDAGYLVFPARYHELPVDALTRVRPNLVLIDAATYRAVESHACRDAVIALGSRVLLFSRSGTVGDGAALQDAAGMPYPVIEYSGDARALAVLVAESA